MLSQEELTLGLSFWESPAAAGQGLVATQETRCLRVPNHLDTPIDAWQR